MVDYFLWVGRWMKLKSVNFSFPIDQIYEDIIFAQEE
jgi:hypothetical protein